MTFLSTVNTVGRVYSVFWSAWLVRLFFFMLKIRGGLVGKLLNEKTHEKSY